MNAEELKKAREICDKATGGPWKQIERDIGDEDFIYVPVEVIAENGIMIVNYDGGLIDWNVQTSYERVRKDAEFIVFARTALPAALDEIEQLQRENAELKTDAEKWRELIKRAGKVGLSETDLFQMVTPYYTVGNEG